MLINSSPPIGATAYGESGQACTVQGVEGDRVLLSCPTGPVRVLQSAIVRWELPPKFQPGDLVEVYFPDHQRWVGGSRFIGPSPYPNKVWLIDRQEIEGVSRIDWVRRQA
jgi:hypothetical protein